MHDPQRDATTLPLIRAAVGRGIPVLGICRGFQEMNVAFGGSLHQAVHQLDGRMDHREPDYEGMEAQYASCSSGSAGTEWHAFCHTGWCSGNSGEFVACAGCGPSGQGAGGGGAGHRMVWWRLSVWTMQPVSLLRYSGTRNGGVRESAIHALFKAFGDACRAYSNERRLCMSH